MTRSRVDRGLWAVLLSAFACQQRRALATRPGAWDLAYDVAYNLAYLAAAVLCWQRRTSVTGARALTAALLVSTPPATPRTRSGWCADPEPFPSVADGLYLAAYPCLCVAVLGAVRRRAPRLAPSMWLDGLVAGLGATAVAAAFAAGAGADAGRRRPGGRDDEPGLPGGGRAAACSSGGRGRDARGCGPTAGWSRRRRGRLLPGRRPRVPAPRRLDGYTEGGWLDQLWLLGTAAAARWPARCRVRRPGCLGRQPARLAGPGAAPALQPGERAVLHGRLRRRLPVLAARRARGLLAAGLVRTR